MPCVSVSWSATTSTTCSQPSNARSRAWPAAGSRPRAVMGKVVGIDLGTTNSLVAYVDGGRPVVIRDEGGDALVPSVVSLGEDATIFVGREALRIINEPTAASLAYGLDTRNRGTIAVYDLGGGTFDISILKVEDGVFQVLSTNGDTHLGGDDIDRLLVEMVLADLAGSASRGTGAPPDPASISGTAEDL